MSSGIFNQEFSAAVAADSPGKFVVVWVRDGPYSGVDVYGQRYDSSGAPRGGEFRVNTYTTSYQSHPAVAVDAAGNFVVAWESFGEDGSGYGVFARRFCRRRPSVSR